MAKSNKVWTISMPIMKNTLQVTENLKEKSSSVLIPDENVQPQSANQSEPPKAKSNKVWTISKPIIKNTLQVTENLKEKSSSVLIPDENVQPQSANQSEPPKAKSAFVCFVCAKAFSSKILMKAHVRRQHGNASKKRQTVCRFCKKNFKTQFLLSCHKKNGHKIPCRDCSKILTSPDALKMHMKFVHSGCKVACSKCSV